MRILNLLIVIFIAFNISSPNSEKAWKWKSKLSFPIDQTSIKLSILSTPLISKLEFKRFKKYLKTNLKSSIKSPKEMANTFWMKFYFFILDLK